MKITYDPHTHTYYSHGKNSVSEMVEAARKAGLSGIHITEHGPAHFYARHIGLSGYKKMREEILAERKKYPEMEILFGVEANIISTEGDIDVDEELCELFDVVNVGFHMMCKMKNLHSYLALLIRATLIKKLHFNFLAKKAFDINTKAILSALGRYKINMITHPCSNYPFDIIKVAEKCAETGTILEINNPRKLANEKMIALVKDINVKFALGSDAHDKKDVGNVQNALGIAERSGLTAERIINVE